MKNKLKRLLSSVLALALVFSTFSIVVSADTQATVTIAETKVAERASDGEQVYKLVFKFKAPTGVVSAPVTNTTVVFSFDNTVIQPVMKAGSYMDLTALTTTQAVFPIDAHKYPDRDIAAMVSGLDYTFINNTWMTEGSRTAGYIESYIVEDKSYGNVVDAAEEEMVFLEFYYRVLDPTKMNRETFKFEKEGTFINQAYPDIADAKAIWIGDYMYGATGKADTIATPTWTYTNSDKDPAGGGSEDEDDEQQATVTIAETKVAERASDGEQVYKLVFKFKAPTGVVSAPVTNTTVVFSFDNTVIQPVMKAGSYMDLTALTTTQAVFPIDAHKYPDRDIAAMVSGLDYTFINNTWMTEGSRTAGYIESYIVEDKSYGNVVDAAEEEMVFLEFYYRVLDPTKMNRETFKFEKEGTFINQAYPDIADAKAIWIGDYMYGAMGKADTIATPTWTYTNSTVAPSAPAKTQVDISGITIEGEKTVTLPAALNLTLGNVPNTVNAHIEYEVGGAWVITAPTAAGTYNVKVVAAPVNAETHEITGTAATATVTINPEPAPEKITPDVSGVAFEDLTKTYDGEAATIATPDVSGIEGIASATVTYVFGEAPVDAGYYSVTLTFTVTDETLYNVPKSKTVTIAIHKKAATFTVNDITRTYGSELPGFSGEFSGLVDESHKDSFNISWDCDATATSNVGEYEINATCDGNRNYDVTVVPGTLTINKAEATVDAITVDSVYASAVSGIENLERLVWAKTPHVTAKYDGGNKVMDVEEWQFDSENEFDIKGGTYTLTAVLEEDDNLTIADAPKATIIIEPVTVTGINVGPVVTLMTDAVENAETLADIGLGDTVKVTFDKNIPEEDPLDVVWNTTIDDIKAIEVDGEGIEVDYSYTGLPEWATDMDDSDKKITVKVVNKEVKTVTVEQADSVYGEALADVVITDESGAELDFDFDITYNNDEELVPTDAGEYTIAVRYETETTVYEGSGTLTITKADIDVSGVAFEDLTKTYDGEAATIATPDVSGITGIESAAVTYSSGAAPVNAGTYTATLTFTADANHNAPAEKTATITISKADVDVSGVVFEDLTKTYDGEAATIATPDVSGIAGVESAAVTYSSGAAPVNAGTYTAILTFTADANHNAPAEKTATITISKADVDVSGVVFEGLTKTYDGEAATIATPDVSGITGIESAAVTYEGGSAPVNAGTYTATLTFTADANHNAPAEKTATITINKADIDVSGVAFADATETYDGEAIEIAPADVPEGVAATVKYNGSEEAPVNAGTYTVTATLAVEDEANYTLVGADAADLEATLTINKADIDVSGVAFEALTKTYDGEAATIATPDVSGITGIASADVTYEGGSAPVNAGTYTATLTFTVTNADNYNVPDAKTATITINKADIDVSGVTFADQSIRYTGSAIEIAPANVPEGVVVTVAYADSEGTAMETAPVEVGTYTATATLALEDADNYELVGEADLTATLTITSKPSVSGGSTGGGTAAIQQANKNNKNDKTEDKTDDTTTTPVVDTEVKVEVSEPSATVDAKDLEGKETVSATVETADGTKVDITADVKDSEVASLTVAADKADAEVTGKAAAGAVTEPIVITVDAKDADNNAVEVTTDVAIPAETEAYAYAVDEMGNTTRLDSVYNAETGMVEVLDVADGTVVVLSTVAPAEFADVDGRWSEKEIQNAADLGLVNGKLDSKFDPSNNLTRSESFKLQKNIIDALGLALEASADAKIDTNASDWAYESDLWAAQAGITTGTGSLEDGTIVVSGNANITRQDYVTAVARMLKRVIDVEYEIEGKVFADAHNVAEYATDAVAYLSGLGIINGTEAANGMLFNPTSNITREEAAAISNRVYAYVAGILAAK